MKIFFLALLFLGGMASCQNEKVLQSSKPFPFLVWGFSVEGFPISKDHLGQLEQETKIPAQLIQFFLQWPASANHEQPIVSSLEAIGNIGATPCLTWEPMFIIDGQEKVISYETILNGQYDPYLIHMAHQIKQWKLPLIIRFAHEMNLNRYHWGMTQEQFGAQSPEIYIKLFRYVVTLFRKQQVDNVLWAFCPNIDSVPNQPWNQVKNYYPGDDYVDILGMDGYNWDITPEIAKERGIAWAKPWQSFEQLFNKLYHELKQLAPNKPILVFETASVDREGKKKSLWIKEALQTAKKWDLVGIIWFQLKKEEDWRLQQYNNYSYVPIIRSAITPFQEWLLNYLKSRPTTTKES